VIELDVPNRRLDLLVEPADVTRRLAEVSRKGPEARRGYRWLYARHVLQAEGGCDFDFLRAGGGPK
jgi:dihydroxyacid dehydratase/phosphogluconate dehydratase